MDSASITPEPTTALPRLGRYQLLTKLGRGGMGEVYLARDTELDRDVALKLLPPESVHDPDAVGRFQREARALAKLSHPGIVQAFDSGSDGGRHFLVMEYVEGQSLAALLRDGGRIPPGRAADFVHQAALALAHAHEKGLVHRDLKPSNLLVTPRGQVKLLDLGLARFLQDQIADPNRTREGVGMGTPDYAAPEQFRDAHSADPRADIYSLGCTLYHLLAGRVPFPTSSLSEKYTAHATKEPAPLEELCPDAPAGLVLAVQKMMAKRPADRFQSAAEVAEALTPHVAGSSMSFAHIRNTTTWHRSQLTLREMPRRRALRWTLAGLTVAALVGVGFVLASLLRPAATPPPDPDARTARDGDGPAKDAPAKDKKEEDKPKPDEEPDDPNVLTVAQKGKAKYRTIGAALDEVKPGQTIRILDDAVYHETLTIKGPTLHAGITLEAPSGAVLERDKPDGKLLHLVGAPRVTVRDLRLRARQAPRVTLVSIQGDCAGLRLEALEFSSDGEPTTSGVEAGGVNADTDREPMVILGCTFRRLGLGVLFVGYGADTMTNVAVRDSLFVDCYTGARLDGRVLGAQIVGNRFSGAVLSATQFQMLSPDSENIVLANNSIIGCVAAFRLWDSEVKGKGVRLQNNLVLAGQSPDLYFLEAEKIDMAKGPGDGEAMAKAYDFGHNWREGRRPTGAVAKAWAAPDPKKGDVFQEKIEGVNRGPKSPDFLRPDPKSPLATEGAGVTDPSLPRYVGALPPQGTPAWDWDRIWRLPKDAQLLTVSKEEKGGGKYRTINDALKDANPWATVRVLDDADYPEVVTLGNKTRHEGVWLDAPRRATLVLGRNTQTAVAVRDVPSVRLTGFRFTDVDNPKDVMRRFVTVTGRAAGTVLSDLHFEPRGVVVNVVLYEIDAGPGDRPVCVERCRFEPSGSLTNDAVLVTDRPARRGCRGVCVRDNRITRCQRGVVLQGRLTDVHVTGNLVWRCKAVCLQLENLDPASRGIVLANNTAFGCDCFRVWDNKPYPDHEPGQVEVVNNLLFKGEANDAVIVQDLGTGGDVQAGDGASLVRKWRFHRNHRDLSGNSISATLPLGAGDVRLDPEALEGKDPGAPDRIRPRPGTPLAARGAGTADATLPTYVGALPPPGVVAWDWDRTWRARAPRAAEEKKDAPR
jgi:hypothetical protein